MVEGMDVKSIRAMPARVRFLLATITFCTFLHSKVDREVGIMVWKKRANVATAEFVFSHLQKCGKHSDTVTVHNVHAVLTEQLLA